VAPRLVLGGTGPGRSLAPGQLSQLALGLARPWPWTSSSCLRGQDCPSTLPYQGRSQGGNDLRIEESWPGRRGDSSAFRTRRVLAIVYVGIYLTMVRYYAICPPRGVAAHLANASRRLRTKRGRLCVLGKVHLSRLVTPGNYGGKSYGEGNTLLDWYILKRALPR
jgi:hypothetical protein